MNILVTGGAGYIGSHTCVELLERGDHVVVIDNLHNSKEESVKRVEKITGKSIEFCKVDLLDKPAVDDVFAKHRFDSCIHFAGLKAVGESTEIPLTYFQNNVTGTLNLLEIMKKYDMKNIVFSSSCTVYGEPKSVPITEDFPLSAASPYGRSKLMNEEIFRDLAKYDDSWNIALLRYFNPIGAHESGIIGEDPNGLPNNLLPYISQVAVGKLEYLRVFGDDYPTHDGTGVRDYIHVVDLAKAHLKAVDQTVQSSGLVTYNLGTGIGCSVLDVIKAFEKASGKNVPYKILPRRSGDVTEAYANPEKANRELGWTAEYSIDRMCVDTWRWQSQNPDGYGE